MVATGQQNQYFRCLNDVHKWRYFVDFISYVCRKHLRFCRFPDFGGMFLYYNVICSIKKNHKHLGIIRQRYNRIEYTVAAVHKTLVILDNWGIKMNAFWVN